MLTLEEMLVRLGIAVLLGAIVGIERELAGKEAGVRTDIMVAAGAAMFTLAGLTIPYLVAVSPDDVSRIIAGNSGFLQLIANIVVGIGFLGAGIIVKHRTHVSGLTTAAAVWFVAAVGILAALGLFAFAAISTVVLTVVITVLRRIPLLDESNSNDYQQDQ